MVDHSRYRGALLGALVGDVLGAPSEGHPGGVPEAAMAPLLGGSSVLPFTGDTALTMALAESLLGLGGIDEEDLARAFAEYRQMHMDVGVVRPTAAAKLFRGLGDSTRLALVLALLDGERRVTDLVDTVGTSQANVSGHLACLRDCGLVESRPEGRQVFYRLAVPEIVEMLRAAEALLAVTGDTIELCPRYQ